MIDWRRGGWSGSINRWADREVQNQLKKNPVALRARYPLLQRLLKGVFSSGSFLRFLILYLSINVWTGVIEVQSRLLLQSVLPSWPTASNGGANQLLAAVPGYLIGAQVSLLGVISLALALVSLIAQRDEASIDVQVYYHESMFFGIVASSLALTFVLTFQLFWPLQLALTRLDAGAENPSFKLFLLVVHSSWFCLNLIGILHFISITFRFVQRSAKEKLRERYTANVLLPQDIRSRLRIALYRSAAQGISGSGSSFGDKAPLIAFGSSFGDHFDSELKRNFQTAMHLADVRVRFVRWALLRWRNRCSRGKLPGSSQASEQIPSIWFTPRFDRPLSGDVVWCRRNGGVPLSSIERIAIRMAFKFERSNDGD